MSLERLEQGILRDAQKRAEHLIEEAEEQARALKAEARKRVGERKKAITEQTAAEVEHIHLLQKTRANMQAKQAILLEKKRLVDEVYGRFAERLEEQKKEIMKDLYDKVRKDVEATQVYVNPADAKLAPSLFKGLKVATRPMTGGFILEAGDQLVDCSFDTILETFRERTIRQVSKELFG
ncbi:MAG: hypothetical protein HY369_00165 [Candidatus Aenigmarchaeota archaeon]|nr:hypothetical protein [Candidatus Aenigmarchaeota archaeon]